MGNEEYIKEEHLYNKKVLEKFNLNIGSKIVIKKYCDCSEKEVQIAWINHHYHWFGTDEGQIFPEEIISINDINVQDEIKKLREIKEQNQAKSLATYLAK
jgi:hypothetical protein